MSFASAAPPRTPRRLATLTAAVAFALAAGFFLEQTWALTIWPWPTSRLSNIFLASIAAAIGAPILWIGLSGEFAAVFGGALNLGVASLGMVCYALLDVAQPGRIAFAAFGALFFLACVVLAVLTRPLAFKDRRRTPRFVRGSFALFALLLLAIGGALALRLANLFPWPLQPEQQVLYGWILLGAACYFLFGLRVPSWGNAKGQLLGFLAYDLVLIVPFLRHFETVRPDLRLNLIIYVSVLLYSGTLAVFFLFVNGRTRLGNSAPD